ncbi:serine/threonine-protein phosphatase [Streptomyces sp. NBC_01343]|nr:serine/threonine-protein phosphatase [Streptomyces sp. NBC_01343]
MPFLITDFTGSSVVRLGAADSVDTDEPAQRVPLRGTLYEDVIRSQQPQVEHRGDSRHVRVIAPVTNRGDAIGRGDTFDYVIDRDTVQLSVTVAMGHDVDAALLATLVVGALRRARREGADLAEQARQADWAMRGHGRSGVVSGQLLRISKGVRDWSLPELRV